VIQRKCFQAGILLLLVSCVFESGAASGLAQSPVNVVLDPQRARAAIAPDYLGLSFEMQRMLADTNGAHFFRPANRRLVATFKALGIKILRVGGNTADRPSLPTPTKADVNSLFAFARAAGVKVIFTLRLNEGSPDDAAQMADYILRHYHRQLDCFAIGNEPNVYFKEFASYLADWKRFAAQITARTNSPAAKFCGPSVSPGHESWSRNFANEFGTNEPLAFVSQHDYPGGDARKVKDPAAARDKILSPAMDDHYAKFANGFLAAAISNGLPCRLEEANSFYDGGAKDVSDTFASALWALDYLWWWAEHGAGGVNFHTGDTVASRIEGAPCRYATFWTSPKGYNIHPIGYAEKMFALGAKGRLVPATLENPDHLNLVVYAASPRKQTLYVTLINREHGPGGRGANVAFAPGFENARARVIFLTAPNGDVSSKTGVTLGGAEIQDNAAWKGKWSRIPGSFGDSRFVLNLPAATAALVKFTAR
jgi:hypothetical protein